MASSGGIADCNQVNTPLLPFQACRKLEGPSLETVFGLTQVGCCRKKGSCCRRGPVPYVNIKSKITVILFIRWLKYEYYITFLPSVSHRCYKISPTSLLILAATVLYYLPAVVQTIGTEGNVGFHQAKGICLNTSTFSQAHTTEISPSNHTLQLSN